MCEAFFLWTFSTHKKINLIQITTIAHVWKSRRPYPKRFLLWLCVHSRLTIMCFFCTFTKHHFDINGAPYISYSAFRFFFTSPFHLFSSVFCMWFVCTLLFFFPPWNDSSFFIIYYFYSTFILFVSLTKSAILCVVGTKPLVALHFLLLKKEKIEK